MPDSEFFLVKAHYIVAKLPETWVLFRYVDGKYEIVESGGADWAEETARKYGLTERGMP